MGLFPSDFLSNTSNFRSQTNHNVHVAYRVHLYACKNVDIVTLIDFRWVVIKSYISIMNISPRRGPPVNEFSREKTEALH